MKITALLNLKYFCIYYFFFCFILVSNVYNFWRYKVRHLCFQLLDIDSFVNHASNQVLLVLMNVEIIKAVKMLVLKYDNSCCTVNFSVWFWTHDKRSLIVWYLLRCKLDTTDFNNKNFMSIFWLLCTNIFFCYRRKKLWKKGSKCVWTKLITEFFSL